MGLTGLILDAKIRLKSIESAMIDQTTIKTENLKETFKAFEYYKEYTYSVAWIDCFAKNDSIGRCILMVGEHSKEGSLKYKNKMKLSIPFKFPCFILNSYSVKAFNTLYYGKFKNRITHQQVPIDTFFYPLDSIKKWNNIYGKNGFIQYQFVLPFKKSYPGLKKILKKISASNKGSFLAILKRFGRENENYLSFPMEGYTLALDFKIEPGLFSLLNDIDTIVLEYEGRFYLTKDARVSKETFEKGYENINLFRSLRRKMGMDKKFNSLQSRRIGI